MSTLTTRDTALQQARLRSIESNTGTRKNEGERSTLSRLFTWYREAVLQPETEAEKENWQKHSF